MNGAQWLVGRLQQQGVQNAFVLPGNGLSACLDAFLDSSIGVVDVRNEQAAAYMADLTGAMTGRPGVAIVSSGPGHTNALTGLTNAWWDGRPMLLISGCSAQQSEGADTFQELDQLSMVEPVCKYSAKVHSVESLPQQVHTALSMAVSGRPGPVHLTIPLDVSSAEVNEAALRSRPPRALVARPRAMGDPGLVGEAVSLLAAAEKPYMIVGSGAFYAQAWEPLAEFAALTDIPFVSHIWDRGSVEEAIPQYMGVTKCGAVTNSALVRLLEADAVLTVGARVDYRVGSGRPSGFPPDARVIRVDIDPAEVDRNLVPDIGIVGDPASVLSQMSEEARRQGGMDHKAWLASVRASRDELHNRWALLAREDTWPLPAIQVCRAIKKHLDDDITLLVDGGNIGQWAHMHFMDRHPAHWMTCGTSGAVGWGFAGAVAAKLARPGHPLLLLSGDGSAGFNITEIETALRFGAPFVAVIAHDGAWGIVADGQKEGRRVASQFGEIRFDRVAQALGAKGVFIERASQLGPAIKEGLASDTVTVIHVPVQLGGPDRCWEARYGGGSEG